MTGRTDSDSDADSGPDTATSGDTAAGAETLPDVAVVVPVYDDPDGVRTTLESLFAQSTDREYRVVVVDNGSTDRTPELSS